MRFTVNRRRPIRIDVYVSKEEKEIIEQNTVIAHAGNMSNYIRQVALNGKIQYIDVNAIRQLHREMGNMNRNLHQIVYRAALTNNLHEQDYQEIAATFEQLRSSMNTVMLRKMHSVSKAGLLPEET